MKYLLSILLLVSCAVKGQDFFMLTSGSYVDRTLQTIANNGRYNGFASVFPTQSGKLMLAYRSGTEHVHGGRVDYITYDISAKTWSSPATAYTPPAGYQVQDVDGGVLGGEKSILFTRRMVDASSAHYDQGYVLSTDLTGSSWGSWVPISMPSGVVGCNVFGSLIPSDTAGVYYQPAYGANTGATVWYQWMWKITYSGGSITDVSIINIGNSSTKYTECVVERLGGGKFICISRENGRTGLWQRTSSDGGNTWSSPTLTNMGSGATGPADATIDCVPELRLCNGSLYCIYMDRSTDYLMVSKANPNTVFASATSWPTPVQYELVLNPFSVPLGYPTTCVIPGTTETQMVVWAQEVSASSAIMKAREDDFANY